MASKIQTGILVKKAPGFALSKQEKRAKILEIYCEKQ